MTRTVAQICRQSSSLSDVQIHILQNSEPLLQFASDLSQRRLSLFVPAREEGALVLAALKKPLSIAVKKGVLPILSVRASPPVKSLSWRRSWRERTA